MPFCERKSQWFYTCVELGHNGELDECLADPEVDPDFPDANTTWTPFAEACYRGNVAAAKKLLAHTRSPIRYNIKHQNMTPFEWASAKGYLEVCKVLLDDDRIKVDTVSIWWSVRSNNVTNFEIVRHILASAQDFNVHEPGRSCKDLAIEHWNTDIAELLQEYEKNPKEVRTRLRREIGGYPEHRAGELFALVVLLCDDYLSLP